MSQPPLQQDIGMSLGIANGIKIKVIVQLLGLVLNRKELARLSCFFLQTEKVCKL